MGWPWWLLWTNPSRNHNDLCSWGCRANWGSEWFQPKWKGSIQDAHITVQELLPIVIAAAMWGVHWKGRSIEAKRDNAAAVACINSGTCCPCILVLLSLYCSKAIICHGWIILGLLLCLKITGISFWLSTHRHTSFPQQFPLPCWTFSWYPSQTGPLNTGRSYFHNGLATSTQKSYTPAKKRYTQFCKDNEIRLQFQHQSTNWVSTCLS